MHIDQFWNAVLVAYERAVRAFAEEIDVVQVHSQDTRHLAPFRARLRHFTSVVYVRTAGPAAAADPCTKLFVWCHTPMVQRCEVAIRVHLECIRACPRVTLLQN